MSPTSLPPPYMHCPICAAPCTTLNEFATHRLDAHELPLPPRTGLAWEPTPRGADFVPPYHRARGLREFALNGHGRPQEDTP